MPALNASDIDPIIARIEAIPEDRVPEWGTLRKEPLIRHFLWAMRESMDVNTETPFQGNLLFTLVLRPLVLNGILTLPKNAKFKDGSGGEVNTLVDHGTLEDLREEMKTFVTKLEDGTLRTATHPVFGDLGPRGWAKLHHIHFEHHFRQFRA